MTLRRGCDLVNHKGVPSTIDFRKTVFWKTEPSRAQLTTRVFGRSTTCPKAWSTARTPPAVAAPESAVSDSSRQWMVACATEPANSGLLSVTDGGAHNAQELAWRNLTGTL